MIYLYIGTTVLTSIAEDGEIDNQFRDESLLNGANSDEYHLQSS